jgi:hypothetical protein
MEGTPWDRAAEDMPGTPWARAGEGTEGSLERTFGAPRPVPYACPSRRDMQTEAPSVPDRQTRPTYAIVTSFDR